MRRRKYSGVSFAIVPSVTTTLTVKRRTPRVQREDERDVPGFVESLVGRELGHRELTHAEEPSAGDVLFRKDHPI